MNRSGKLSIVFGFLLEVLAVFFVCTILMQFFAFGEQQPAIFKIGAVLFQAYGYSSMLIPVCMFVAGLLIFTGYCTLRWSIYLACSIFPFITVVLAERIAKHFLITDTSVLVGFKIAAIFVFAALAVVIEYVLIGMISDYFLAKKALSVKKPKKPKEEKEEIPQNAFSKDPLVVDSNKTEEPEQEETFSFKTTSILNDDKSNSGLTDKTAEIEEEQPVKKDKKDDVTFIIPQYVPYGEQIAKKGSVWKDYNKIGDYIRKTPPKDISAKSENEVSDEEIVEISLKEKTSHTVLPFQKEEESVFLNFKRILVPDEPIIPDPNAEPAKPDLFLNEESPIEALHKSLKAKALQDEAEKIAGNELKELDEDSLNKVNTNIAAKSYFEQMPEVEAEMQENFVSLDEEAFLENPFKEAENFSEGLEPAVDIQMEEPVFEEPKFEKNSIANTESKDVFEGISTVEKVLEELEPIDENIEEFELDDSFEIESIDENQIDDTEFDIIPFDEDFELEEEDDDIEFEIEDFEDLKETKTDEKNFADSFSSLTKEKAEKAEDFEEPKISPEKMFEHELAQKAASVVPEKSIKDYKIPTDGLLNTYPDGQYWIIDERTEKAGEILKQTLSEFKIEADVTAIRKGPVITMFEILPAPGVKLNKIVGLQDNIALRLAASSVRIVAPIPGKHAVGIEVPNKQRSIVSFRELIDNDSPLFDKMEVPVVLGKDITGEAKLLDLAATPNLLIAGSTGSGKSVCVNTMILSILYKRTPMQVKMILIDPKVVELKLYNDIPHLLTPVITEPKKAFQALQYCLCEMERRYALLDRMGVRDIKSYNRRIKERKLANENLPYIVVIIDEFADLMATTGKELESTIARLAAMSRAVGIHLVLATQRPSIDVITGLIKANIPTRIAFMVASKMDSRIIIDQVGAEKLLGKGDMLYASAVDPFPVRIQGTFVSDNEVENVVDYVKKFGPPEYIDEEIFFDDEEEETEPSLFSDGEDPLYEKALDIVLQSGKASASYIQRRLKVGYNRAARLVEEMEARGIVGPANGSKPRDVIHVPTRTVRSSMTTEE